MTEVLSLKTDYKKYSEAYADFYPLIFNVVFLKISNYEEAEDLCQEIFLRMFNKFNEIENIRKWLYGAMRNVLFEYYRKKNLSTEDIEQHLDDSSMSYVNGFRDARLIIEDAMKSPVNFEDEKDKIIFELIAVYNYNFIHAAELMGLTYTQARYKYQKTAERLTAYLKKKGIKDLGDLL